MAEPAFRLLARALGLGAAVLMLWSPASVVGGAGGVQTVAVTMRYSRFIPSHVVVRPGTTVRFVITNEDPISHEFILGDTGVQERHETGTDPEHGAIPGEVTVPPGAAAETTYTFSKPGMLLIGCHAPGHYAYGMRGLVQVVGP